MTGLTFAQSSYSTACLGALGLPLIFLTPRLHGMMQPEVCEKAELQSGVQA